MVEGDGGVVATAITLQDASHVMGTVTTTQGTSDIDAYVARVSLMSFHICRLQLRQ